MVYFPILFIHRSCKNRIRFRRFSLERMELEGSTRSSDLDPEHHQGSCKVALESCPHPAVSLRAPSSTAAEATTGTRRHRPAALAPPAAAAAALACNWPPLFRALPSQGRKRTNIYIYIIRYIIIYIYIIIIIYIIMCI